MKFQELKKNFLDMEFDEQLAFVSAYIEQRQADLRAIKDSYIAEASKPKRVAKKDKVISLTAEQAQILKKLGLI